MRGSARRVCRADAQSSGRVDVVATAVYTFSVVLSTHDDAPVARP